MFQLESSLRATGSQLTICDTLMSLKDISSYCTPSSLLGWFPQHEPRPTRSMAHFLLLSLASRQSSRHVMRLVTTCQVCFPCRNSECHACSALCCIL